MESVQRELEPVKQEQQSEQPKERKLSAGKSVRRFPACAGDGSIYPTDYFSWTIILYRG